MCWILQRFAFEFHVFLNSRVAKRSKTNVKPIFPVERLRYTKPYISFNFLLDLVHIQFSTLTSFWIEQIARQTDKLFLKRDNYSFSLNRQFKPIPTKTWKRLRNFKLFRYPLWLCWSSSSPRIDRLSHSHGNGWMWCIWTSETTFHT